MANNHVPIKVVIRSGRKIDDWFKETNQHRAMQQGIESKPNLACYG